jgi:hypothetical protein
MAQVVAHAGQFASTSCSQAHQSPSDNLIRLVFSDWWMLRLRLVDLFLRLTMKGLWRRSASVADVP